MRLFTSPGVSGNGNEYVTFRCGLPRGCTGIRIYADELYELRSGGKILGTGPVRSAEPLLYYDRYGLSGCRELEVLVHARKGAPAVWAEVECADGGRFEPEWFCRVETRYLPSPDTVGCVGFCEYVRLDAPPGAFVPAIPGRVPAQDEFLPRPLPPFTEGRREPVRAWTEGELHWFDFGEMVSGRVELAGRRTAGETVVEYVESPDSGWAHTEGRREMYADRLSGGGGAFFWRSFNRRAFRYLVLHGALEGVDSAEVRTCGYPVRETGSFTCSDPALNRLWEVSGRTLAVCMDDLYNDCPHRDQAQWMDAFVSARCAFARFGTLDLTRKCLLQHGLCSYRDGRICSPSIVSWAFFVDYALVYILFVKWYWQVSGDLETVRVLWPGIEGQLEWFAGRRAADGLLEHLDREGFVYLDNTFELCRSGKSAGLNALYYGALCAAAELAGALGEPDGERREEAARVKRSFRSVFAHPEFPGCLRDTDSRPEQSFFMVNFSCVPGGSWTGSAARLRVRVSSGTAGGVRLDFAAYAGCAIRLNGRELHRDDREPDWAKGGPMYRPDSVELPLKAGENLLEFIVRANSVNWELFFDCAADVAASGLVCPVEWESAGPTGAEHEVPLPRWNPPRLSESTHGYAGFCGLLDSAAALTSCIPQHFYRHYVGIRVPAFSEITADPEKLAEWIMPCNTPWSAFFFLSALFELGESRAALDWIRMAWGIMLRGNMVNTWEEWTDRASLCHCWGGAPAIFFQQEILGVRQEGLGEKVIRFRPDLGGLEYARGRVVVGESGEFAEVELRRGKNGTTAGLRIPAGFRLREDLSRLPAPVDFTVIGI